MTMERLISWTGMVAVVAGILFVVVQPIHPPDTLASVTTGQWTMVHYLTLAMTVLFAVGVSGIYLRQVEESGWLGLVGTVTLNLALSITAAMVFIEAFVSPILADRDPGFVTALLGLVGGEAGEVDLGPLSTLWAVSGVAFPLGCALVGFSTIRARVLPSLAGAVFGFGLPVAAVVVSLLPGDLHRLGAIPIGVGLAWLGWAVWRGVTAHPVESGAVSAEPSRLS